MVAATISCVRGALWRVWGAPGPASRPLRGLPPAPSASRRQATTDATSIKASCRRATVFLKCRAARPRPETDDLMAATI